MWKFRILKCFEYLNLFGGRIVQSLHLMKSKFWLHHIGSSLWTVLLSSRCSLCESHSERGSTSHHPQELTQSYRITIRFIIDARMIKLYRGCLNSMWNLNSDLFFLFLTRYFNWFFWKASHFKLSWGGHSFNIFWTVNIFYAVHYLSCSVFADLSRFQNQRSNKEKFDNKIKVQIFELPPSMLWRKFSVGVVTV